MLAGAGIATARFSHQRQAVARSRIRAANLEDRPNKRKHIKGSMEWSNADKGFGFIAPDDGTGAVIVHRSAIQADGSGTVQETSA